MGVSRTPKSVISVINSYEWLMVRTEAGDLAPETSSGTGEMKSGNCGARSGKRLIINKSQVKNTSEMADEVKQSPRDAQGLSAGVKVALYKVTAGFTLHGNTRPV